MSNRPVDYQFWLDVGGLGWAERLYQPLTQPYVLSRRWPYGCTLDRSRRICISSQEALYRLAVGLIRRCRRSIFLGLSDLGEGGYEMKGPFLKAIQRMSAEVSHQASRCGKGAAFLMFTPRPKQRDILAYSGGRMGISAVPGSGKTQILSLLAAQIIASGSLEDDQEVLVVTLVNSAVDNFSIRVGDLVQEMGLLPNLGYRVRTLHGLAHDIVRERPDLLGLADNFQIIDERIANQIRRDAAQAWLKSNPDAMETYLNPTVEESKLDWVRREHIPNKISEVALAFIRYAKDRQLTPQKIAASLENLPLPLHLAQMCAEIYQSYQQALIYRGALDFDDLIRLALQALTLDESYLERLRHRWPYILEDEAQDSSKLQEEILETLSASFGNWVRVGDPNQAIFETFHHRQSRII